MVFSLRKIFNDLVADITGKPSLSAPSQEQINAFVKAAKFCETNSKKIITRYIKKYPTYLDKKDDNGNTALIWAAQCGNTDCVKSLIAAGAKLDEKNDNGWTALIWAAYWGETDCVKSLITAGAKLDETNNIGKTALDYARECCYTKIVQLLEEAMAPQRITAEKQRQKRLHDAVSAPFKLDPATIPKIKIIRKN